MSMVNAAFCESSHFFGGLTDHRGILSTHLTSPMKEFIAANQDWLTVFQLPSYAPGRKPQEGVWALVKRGIGNLAAANVDHLAKAVRTRLKKIQYRPNLIDGCLAQSGPDMNE
ncbi:hypothetical protein ACIRYZ_44520 [Kitasatospora sp. NPDC101155]|uniref:hypothetical protein n=1 Tax=Kitasatospora sp. NPDC101155 TaxID=3364097 RepID=UPI00380E8BFF